jgi:hypothetical protein
MCLLLTMVFFGPRTAIFLWWLVNPERWERVYDTFILPFVGFLFAPWTTLMYVIVGTAGLNGLDYLWMGLAILADLVSISGSGAYGQRRRSAPAVAVYE